MALETFFTPKTVAVIGASATSHKVGATIFRNFLNAIGWHGEVIPINPNKYSVLKKKSYHSVLDYAGNIDQAIIAVPAVIVPKVLRDCVDKKIPSVVIISSGFKEVGNVLGEEELKRIIYKTNTRIIGPNCLGLYDAYSKMNSIFLPVERFMLPGRGKVSIISQSGAVGSVLLDILADQNIGVSKFISYGNAVDVDEADLITYLSEDKNTNVIIGYIEGVRDGSKFMSACKKSNKPIILLKAGRHKETSGAIQSHTGTLAGSYEIYSGALKQVGVARVEDWESLLDVAKAHLQETPKGNKILVVTDGGGFGILATDAATEEGLVLPMPSKDTVKKIEKKVPRYAILKNPLDLTGDATAERYKLALETTLKYDNYDAIVIITLWQIPTLDVKTVDTIISLNKKYKTPFYCIAPGSDYTQKIISKLEKNNIPVYPTPLRCMKAISKVLENK